MDSTETIIELSVEWFQGRRTDIHSLKNILVKIKRKADDFDEMAQQPFGVPTLVVIATLTATLAAGYVAYNHLAAQQGQEMIPDDEIPSPDSQPEQDAPTTWDTQTAVAALFAVSAVINLAFALMEANELATLGNNIEEAKLDDEFNQLTKLAKKTLKSINAISNLVQKSQRRDRPLFEQLKRSIEQVDSNLRLYREKIKEVHDTISRFHSSAASLRDRSTRRAVGSVGLTISGFIGLTAVTGGAAIGLYAVGVAASLWATGQSVHTARHSEAIVQAMSTHHENLRKHKNNYMELREKMSDLCDSLAAELDRELNLVEVAAKQKKQNEALIKYLRDKGLEIPEHLLN